MNERLERNIEAYLLRQIEKLGGFTVKTGKNGFPDRTVFLKYNLVYLVETKSLKGKPRKLQAAVHKRLKKKFQLDTYILSSKESVDTFVFMVKQKYKFNKLKEECKPTW